MKVGAMFAIVAMLGCGTDASDQDAGRTDASLDASSSDVASDQTADAIVDAVAPVDAAPDAPSDAGLDGSPVPTCATAVAPDASIVYTGTTCSGQNLIGLSCNNAVAHPEVAVRIDGQTGQVWSVMAQGAFAVGVYDSFAQTGCTGQPSVCAAAARDAGTSGVVDGPFPNARTDYVIFETLDPTPCGPYTIVVTLM